MPVPQRLDFLVEQASCLFLNSLLTIVPHLRLNQFAVSGRDAGRCCLSP
ncbi:hypothetical protein QUB28_23530 [Microcoleus sp. B4-C3]